MYNINYFFIDILVLSIYRFKKQKSELEIALDDALGGANWGTSTATLNKICDLAGD